MVWTRRRSQRAAMPALSVVLALIGAAAFALAGPVGAWAGSGGEGDEVVDVELVLAVDVSLSMSPSELDIQREGYVAALVHEQVLAAIRSGLHGKIAVTYFEWAGETSQRLVVPWTRIASRADAEAFVALLTATPARSARRTSISSGLLFAESLFENNGFRGMKRVIDVSGDGPNNQGPPVDEARDGLVARGIVVNGLPLMTNSGMTTRFDLPDLDRYYAHCVIGGPGSFVIPVTEWSHFPETIRRKLVLELAGRPPNRTRPSSDRAARVVTVAVRPAQAPAGGYDCLIGEKMWQDRQRFWNEN
ncbi:DUF1194 domain-containing protein [Nitratireductor sp. StC3]|uniref:DUF1194 domain-containing protein n=1 Tax=Nitratireductor sp. StC3 TaxID=2126741 RepID=UPI001FE077F6|nr:DUF1194 domain-containing protein [Nitratireductor sp. StC3]